MRAFPRRSWLASLLGAAAVMLAVVASANKARRWHPRPAPTFTLSLQGAHGEALPMLRRGGRSIVLGRRGQRFSVVVRNRTARRVEAVVSVDGLDVLSGERVSPRRHRGYIVPARGQVRITGFRTSMRSVAAFRFSAPHESFAVQQGHGRRSLGVVKAAIFPERRAWRHARRKAAAKSKAPSARRPWQPRGGNLGTEFGEARESHVVGVRFIRQSRRPQRTLTLRYDELRRHRTRREH